MRVLFVSYESHNNIKAWSGMIKNISSMLEKKYEVDYFDDIKLGFFSKVVIALTMLKDRIFHTKTKYLRIPKVVNDYTKKIQKAVDASNCDFVFTVRPHLLCNVQTSKPMIIFADGCFRAMLDYYPSFTGLSKKHIRDCEKQEQKIFNNCSLGFFTSPWAMITSKEMYSIGDNKFFNVNIGSNMPFNHNLNDIYEMIEHRLAAPVKNVLFVGVDWDRKGGDIAVKAVFDLNKMGIASKLIIVGCSPEIKADYLPYVEVVGRIDKSEKSGLKKLDDIYKSSACFILPSRNECASVSIAEASSYGLYSITSTTGGTDGVIIGGRNGVRLPMEATAKDYSAKLFELLTDNNVYKNRSVDSFRVFSDYLNWDSVLSKIDREINSKFLKE